MKKNFKPSPWKQAITETIYHYTAEVDQWWAMQSEQYRKGVIGDIPGTLAYGLTKSPNLLSQATKDRIVKTWAERTIECTICRREVPVEEYYREHIDSHPCE